MAQGAAAKPGKPLWYGRLSLHVTLEGICCQTHLPLPTQQDQAVQSGKRNQRPPIPFAARAAVFLLSAWGGSARYRRLWDTIMLHFRQKLQPRPEHCPRLWSRTCRNKPSTLLQTSHEARLQRARCTSTRPTLLTSLGVQTSWRHAGDDTLTGEEG